MAAVLATDHEGGCWSRSPAAENRVAHRKRERQIQMDGKDQVGRPFLFMEARRILHEPKTCHNFAMESSVIERTAGGCSRGVFNHEVKQHLFNSILITKFQLLDDHYQRRDLMLFSCLSKRSCFMA